MGANLRRKNQAYSQPLFGRGGLGERRFSQRSGLSPRNSLPRILSLLHNFFAKGLALFGKMGYNKDVSFVNVRVLR